VRQHDNDVCNHSIFHIRVKTVKIEKEGYVRPLLPSFITLLLKLATPLKKITHLHLSKLRKM
jgi:hypothetical protein